MRYSSSHAQAPLFPVDGPFDPPSNTTIYTVDPSTGAMTVGAEIGAAYTPILALAAVDGRTLYAAGKDNSGIICTGATFVRLLLKIVLDAGWVDHSARIEASGSPSKLGLPTSTVSGNRSRERPGRTH